MFSRFQMLVAGLRVLEKGYCTSDHVKKIIRSLPKKWRPMVTALKVAKDLNSISLEELISSLRSPEIELQEDEPRRKVKSVALKSSSRKAKALQAEESENSEESSEEDEFSLISRRINRLWKHRQGRRFSKGPRNGKGRFESTSGQKKAADKEVICFECKELGHYKNECPTLKKDGKPKRFHKGKKGLMATWDDSESEEEDSEGEQAAIALMARTGEEPEVDLASEAESDSDEEDEVLSPFSPHELKACLLEIMEKYNTLLSKHKILKKDLVATSEASERYEKTISELDEKNFSLTSSNVCLRNKITKLEKEFSSGGSDSDNEKNYEKSFQYFLAKNVDRSKMASLIYGVSRNNKKGLGYSEPYEKHKTLNKKPKDLYEQFVPSGPHVRSSEPVHSEGSQRQPQKKKNKSSRTKPHAQIPLKYSAAQAPKVPRTSGQKTNKRGPRKWVRTNKIILLAD